MDNVGTVKGQTMTEKMSDHLKELEINIDKLLSAKRTKESEFFGDIPTTESSEKNVCNGFQEGMHVSITDMQTVVREIVDFIEKI